MNKLQKTNSTQSTSQISQKKMTLTSQVFEKKGDKDASLNYKKQLRMPENSGRAIINAQAIKSSSDLREYNKNANLFYKFSDAVEKGYPGPRRKDTSIESVIGSRDMVAINAYCDFLKNSSDKTKLSVLSSYVPKLVENIAWARAETGSEKWSVSGNASKELEFFIDMARKCKPASKADRSKLLSEIRSAQKTYMSSFFGKLGSNTKEYKEFRKSNPELAKDFKNLKNELKK